MPIKNKSSKKLLKKGGTISSKFINVELNTTSYKSSVLFNEINDILNTIPAETLKILVFLQRLNDNKKDTNTIFDDITKIVNTYKKSDINFQSVIYNLFNKYELFTFENERHFITIDPTIIQIMIFDEDVNNMDDNNDIVYSLKLIIRDKNKLTLRYTTHLFPNESKTNELADLTNFNNFNLSLKNPYIITNYDAQLKDFLKKYIKFYNFYRKCYTFNEANCDKPGEPNSKKLIEYQLKYISILGKARFGDPIIQVRTAVVTDYIMSNLLFASPSYAFISGGYKGFKDNKYGVTRSGYEISKRYNRPILTIMCAEGLHDSHEYSDATLIYGEHWGEDSIALSQLTDGAIIIAPFGGWTYIECLTLLANKKIVGIYNDFFNILNYDKDIASNENENSNFFKFTLTEQKNIINYNINYYLILLYLLNKEKKQHEEDVTIDEKPELQNCLELGVKLLSVLKLLLNEATNKYRETVVKTEEDISRKTSELENLDNIENFDKIDDELNTLKKLLKTQKQTFATTITNLISIIKNFNDLKTIIHNRVFINLANINKLYKRLFPTSTYQEKIPEKCDGIWIKPLFDLFTNIIDTSNVNVISITGGKKRGIKGGSECRLEGHEETLLTNLKTVTIDISTLLLNTLFLNLHNNIIFVFSDVMYLNIYLNENLNSSSFQRRIQDKITALLRNDVLNLNNIINEERKYEVVLSRKIDGTLDEATKSISNIIKLRQDYTFKINDDCNNYTNLITDTSKPMTPVDVNQIINDPAVKNTLIQKYNEVNKDTMKKQGYNVITKSQSLRDLLPKRIHNQSLLTKAATERTLLS
jgi:hypothetical protein